MLLEKKILKVGKIVAKKQTINSPMLLSIISLRARGLDMSDEVYGGKDQCGKIKLYEMHSFVSFN
jgi:hypothetical protein